MRHLQQRKAIIAAVYNCRCRYVDGCCHLPTKKVIAAAILTHGATCRQWVSQLAEVFAYFVCLRFFHINSSHHLPAKIYILHCFFYIVVVKHKMLTCWRYYFLSLHWVGKWCASGIDLTKVTLSLFLRLHVLDGIWPYTATCKAC